MCPRVSKQALWCAAIVDCCLLPSPFRSSKLVGRSLQDAGQPSVERCEKRMMMRKRMRMNRHLILRVEAEVPCQHSQQVSRQRGNWPAAMLRWQQGSRSLRGVSHQGKAVVVYDQHRQPSSWPSLATSTFRKSL